MFIPWNFNSREDDEMPDDSRVMCNQGKHELVETGGRHTWCRVCDLDFELVAWEWVPEARRNREPK